MTPNTSNHPHPLHRRPGRDGGAATIELAVATPLLLLALLTVAQTAVWAHAAHIARAVATHAAHAAAADSANAADGHAAGTAALRQLGPRVLTSTRIEVTRTPTQVHVTVTGAASSVIPGMHPPVRVTLTHPVERLTTSHEPASASASANHSAAEGEICGDQTNRAT